MPEIRKIVTINCRQGAVRAVRYNADGAYCLTCGSDKSLKLWNPRKPLLLQTYNGHGYEVLDAQGSTDSTTLVSAGMDKAVFLWDVSTAQVIQRWRAHAAQTNCVRFNPEASVVVSGSVDGTVKAWDCRGKSRDPIQVMDEGKDSITSLCVSAHEIASGSLDGKVRRYDLRKGMLNVDDAISPVGNICFTKDGQCILVNCINNKLKLIDKDTGEVLAEFKGHSNKKYRVEGALLKDDTIVVSGSEDGFVHTWNLIEGTSQGRLFHENHRVVHSLSSHPNGNELLTAAEGFVYLWSDDVEEEDEAVETI